MKKKSEVENFFPEVRNSRSRQITNIVDAIGRIVRSLVE
jgi:hypothetical protein